MDVSEGSLREEGTVLEVALVQHPGQVVEEQKLGLELLQLSLISKGPVFENRKDEMSMLIGNPLTSDDHIELPERCHSLRLMPDEETSQAGQNLIKVLTELSVMHLHLLKKCLTNF